ncbi:MAG TPA: AAA domain-containing protein [Jatrophihabitantaceae bacterium]|nr:AAA domain-containing protein [Jatrophihabitantaceae bacterium]
MYALVEEHHTAQQVERIRGDLVDTKNQGWVTRLAAVSTTVRTRRLLTDAEAAALSARSTRMAAESDLRNAGFRLPDKTLAAVDTTSLQAARAQLDNAVTAERASAEEATTAAARCRACTQRRETAARAPQPTSRDLALLERADKLELPSIQEQLPGLHRAVAETDETLRRLRAEHEKLVKKVGETRFAIERDVLANATVVATTLAMLTLKKVITDKPFDHVIVDEAAAACLPDVVHAVGHARTGAVVLGDYLQNGPIVDDDIEKVERLNALYQLDCFTNFHLTDPVKAQQNPGCVVMTEQWRFGEKLTRLANLVAYGGRLSAVQPKACDIVLIDCDGLGSALNTIRRPHGGWAGTWPIGALVARALAEHHHGRDGTIGVVVPYTAQSKATHELLAESACGPDIEVGTAHTFQGRECDVVIFDLVEDGRGWLAKASLNGGSAALGGLRVFNVATTRARHRLYLIADGAAIRRARSGPLHAIGTMIDERLIEQVRASEVLGLDDHDAPAEGTAHHDVWTALQPYVRLVGIYDEKMVLDTVQQRIDSASRSVWMWSPWVGRHSTTLQDSLVHAADRGLQVRVMALPETEINAKLRESLATLRGRIPHTLLVHNMHQKIVVIDDRWTFVGSMNLLSHAKRPADRRHEIMIQVESARFALEILSFELAQQLRQLQQCAACGKAMCEVVEAGRNPARRWYWLCGNDIDGTPCPERLPLPDRVGRNRPAAGATRRPAP